MMIFLLILLWVIVGMISVFTFHRTLLIMDEKDWREINGDDIIWYVLLGSVMGYFAVILFVIAAFALVVNFIANSKPVKSFQRKSFYIGKNK
jgi:hypothetical protein